MKSFVENLQDHWMHGDPLFKLIIRNSFEKIIRFFLSQNIQYFPREFAPSKLLKINEAYSLTLVFTVVAATKL